MKDKRLEKLANNIRAERNRKNYSQEKLSELSGISVSSISLIERKLQVPSIFVVCQIAKALEVDIKELLKDI